MMAFHLGGGTSNGGIAAGHGNGCISIGARASDFDLDAAGRVRKRSTMPMCAGGWWTVLKRSEPDRKSAGCLFAEHMLILRTP